MRRDWINTCTPVLPKKKLPGHSSVSVQHDALRRRSWTSDSSDRCRDSHQHCIGQDRGRGCREGREGGRRWVKATFGIQGEIRSIMGRENLKQSQSTRIVRTFLRRGTQYHSRLSRGTGSCRHGPWIPPVKGCGPDGPTPYPRDESRSPVNEQLGRLTHDRTCRSCVSRRDKGERVHTPCTHRSREVLEQPTPDCN